jgi:hypothetical protein
MVLDSLLDFESLTFAITVFASGVALDSQLLLSLAMSSADLFHQLDSYDWNGDQEFQLGLNGILANAPAEQRNDLTLRARCSYFAR